MTYSMFTSPIKVMFMNFVYNLELRWMKWERGLKKLYDRLVYKFEVEPALKRARPIIDTLNVAVAKVG